VGVTLWVATHSEKSRYSAVLLLLSSTIFISIFGIRVQVVGWLFFSLVFFIERSMSYHRRIRWVLPVIFLLWANMHASFILGLFLVFYYTGIRIISRRKITLIDVILPSICCAVTLINPFGFNLWISVWTQLSDTNLYSTISEWKNILYFPNGIFWIYTATSLFFIYRYRRKYKWYELVLYSLFLVESLSIKRNVPFWIIISLPFTIHAIRLFAEEVKALTKDESRLDTAYKIFFCLCGFLCIIQLTYEASILITEKNFYPVGAVNYLNEHTYPKQIFAPFEWNGYLLWRMPQEKVFVSGMMPTWRRDKAPLGESKNAYDEYIHILLGKESFNIATEKYSIKTIILPVAAPQATDLASYVTSKIHRTPFEDSKVFKSIENRLNANWKKVYNDDRAAIYEFRE
jgi:hypothetical protein